MSKNREEQGFSPALILIIMGVLVLVAAAGSYYYLRALGKAPAPRNGPQETVVMESVSNDNDVATLEAELEATIIESPDDDFSDLDKSASEL